MQLRASHNTPTCPGWKLHTACERSPACMRLTQGTHAHATKPTPHESEASLVTCTADKSASSTHTRVQYFPWKEARNSITFMFIIR